MNVKKSMKRFLIGLGASALISFAIIQPSYAQSVAELLLAQILGTTQAILNEINKLPAYLEDITKMARSWNETNDDNNTIARNQQNFATIANTDPVALSQQIDLSNQFTRQFLTVGGASMPSNAYELGYSVLLNQPITAVPGDTSSERQQQLEAAKKNYLKYISGSDILFKQIQPSWSDDTKKQYQSIYNTATAISSYNAFLLSGLYTNQLKETTRNELTAQATSSDWFAQIAGETLGLVLRQMLMYTSQIYVELDHIAKAQQDQLAVQAMTNSLLILYANYAVAQNIVTMGNVKQQQEKIQQRS